jgi:hypothetical protein
MQRKVLQKENQEQSQKQKPLVKEKEFLPEERPPIIERKEGNKRVKYTTFLHILTEP